MPALALKPFACPETLSELAAVLMAKGYDSMVLVDHQGERVIIRYGLGRQHEQTITVDLARQLASEPVEWLVQFSARKGGRCIYMLTCAYAWAHSADEAIAMVKRESRRRRGWTIYDISASPTPIQYVFDTGLYQFNRYQAGWSLVSF